MEMNHGALYSQGEPSTAPIVVSLIFKLEFENELAFVATSEEEVEGLDVLGDTTLSNVRFDLCQCDVQRSHETIVGGMIPAGGSCLGLGLYRSRYDL